MMLLLVVVLRLLLILVLILIVTIDNNFLVNLILSLKTSINILVNVNGEFLLKIMSII